MLSVVVDSLTFIGPFSKIAVPAGNNNNTKKNNNNSAAQAASSSASSTTPAKNNKAASSPPKPNKEVINPILPRILLVARSFLHSSLVPHYFMLDDTFTGFGRPVIRSDDPSTHGKLPLSAQQRATPKVITKKAELQHANSLIRFLVKSSTLQFTRTLKLLAPPLKPKNIEDTIRRFVSFPYFCRTVSKLYLNGETVDDIKFHLIKQMRSLRSLTFDSCTKLTRNSIPHLGSFTELDELVFCGGFRQNRILLSFESGDDEDDEEGTADSQVKVFDDFFTALANMKYLRILTLQSVDLRLHYSVTTSLDKMNKYKKQIDEKFQGRLARQSSRLEQISIRFDFLSPAIGFIFLDGLPRLRVLNLDVMNRAGHYEPSPGNEFHQSVYKTFASVSPTLEHLEVNASTNYCQCFVQDHDEIMKLEEEQAANGGDNTPPADNSAFQQVIHFEQLLSLEICLPTNPNQYETYRGFQQVLDSAPKLKHLRIEGDQAVEIGLFREIFFKNSSSNSIASSTKNVESRLIFPSLESLDFSTAPHIVSYRTEAAKLLVADICESHTQLQQNLKSFNISSLPMQIGLLENISSLSKLEVLDISSTQMHIDSNITDEDVVLYYSPIKRMKQLRILSALSVKVRPYLFEVLSTLENLEIVEFASVSPHDIAILEAGNVFLNKNTSSKKFQGVKNYNYLS